MLYKYRNEYYLVNITFTLLLYYFCNKYNLNMCRLFYIV